MDMFRNSSLGLFKSQLSAVQSTSKAPTIISSSSPVPQQPPLTNHQPQLDTEETARLCQFLPVGPRPWKPQEAAGISPQVLWPVILYEVMTCIDQQCDTRQTNIGALSAKTSEVE